jgi:hypothetical protein
MSVDFPQAAQVDYLDTQQIVGHFRALIDLHDFLLNGYDKEVVEFTKLLRLVGWSKDKIIQFQESALQLARYNWLVDPPIPEQGDRFEWENNRYRWRK